jgi:hypothetical protein
MNFPRCPKCSQSILLPLSDYGGEQGAGSVMYKAWVCIKENCGWTLRIDRGQPAYTVTTAHK